MAAAHIAIRGVYRHYKGAYYFAESIARHSETGEALVVYRQLYGDFGQWARPLTMWGETVRIGHELVPRFRRASDADVRAALADEEVPYSGC